MKHVASQQQTTGEAIYVDDTPRIQNELLAAFFYTTKAKAKIASIDYKEALALPGVEAIFTAKDIPSEFSW